MDTVVDEDAGAAFNASSRPAAKDASVVGHDAGPPPSDGGVPPKTYCTGALAAGDLAIVELMISSRAGSGDDGEWIELQSTRDCWLALDGVEIGSPRGTTNDAVTTPAGFDLAPHATFVVADSADPAKNHGLPGTVLSFEATDVLKNSGDIVYVKHGDVTIDSLTYPAFTNLEPGRSLAFPSDCTAPDRADWARWSLTFGTWAGAGTFEGTPNAPNDDVACH